MIAAKEIIKKRYSHRHKWQEARRPVPYTKMQYARIKKMT